MHRFPARIFAVLLRLLPAEFRTEYGAEMEADFQDQRGAASYRGGRSAVARVWLSTFFDILRSSRREHLDILARDLTETVRTFRRHAGVTVTALATLTVAIGVNAGMFGVADAVLFKSLNVPDSHRLVRVFEGASVNQDDQPGRVSPGSFLRWEAGTEAFESLAFVMNGSPTFGRGGSSEELNVRLVSARFFEVIGIQPAIGRAFLAAEYSTASFRDPGAPTPIVLGYELWMGRFKGERAIVGATVQLGQGPKTVIGVMSPETFLNDIAEWGQVDCWLPFSPDAAHQRVRYGDVVGKLVSRATVQEAEKELNVLSHAGIGSGTAPDIPRVHVLPLLETIVSRVRGPVWSLVATVGTLLLIVCAHVGSLLLILVTGRSRDIALRLAMGASVARLVRQTLTGAFLLAFGSGLAGTVAAWWLMSIGLPALPDGFPRANQIRFDHRVWLFSLLVSGGVAVVCSLPASLSFHHGRGRLSTELNAGWMSQRSRKLRHVLLIGNLAAAFVLVVAAVQLARTMAVVNALDLGFRPERIISIGFRPTARQDFESWRRSEAQILAQVGNLPSVIGVGIGSPPLGGAVLGTYVQVPGHSAERLALAADVVSEGYLNALGSQLLSGRYFNSSDRIEASGVVILNRSAAASLFATEAAVGKTLLVGDSPRTVVGVVADIRRKGLEQEPEATLYLLSSQTQFFRTHNLVIRSAGDPADILPAVLAILEEFKAPSIQTRIHVTEDLIDQSKAPRRLAMTIVASLSGLAVFVAVIGVYSLLRDRVAERTPEIGVRMALGASPSRIVRLIVGHSLGLVLAGVVVGLLVAIALRGLIAGFLVGVEASDPASYLAATVLLAVSGTMASLIPALSAASIRPTQLLRRE